MDENLAAKGLKLPRDFVTFEADSKLHCSLDDVSVTCCWTDISEPLPSPVEPGAFLVRFPAFHDRRQQDAPESLGMLPGLEDGTTRPTPHGPELLRIYDSGFVAQLAMPNARFFTMPADDGTVNTYVPDSNDSFAVLSPDGDGWTVRQGGPVLLRDEAERSLALWQTAGAPGPSEFGVSVTADSQQVWPGTPSGPSWSLPIV
ncbi:hypothetical protein [Streptomyces sp. NPDC056105]|uniref:hypothetical protein n=1 Tax=Streptomyces sp. NPDC056105 TaxID=3345714 RepID=UPI0035D616AD